MNSGKNIYKFIIFSIILHVIIFALWGWLYELNIFAAKELPDNILDTEPLVFELQEKRRPAEVVETPEDAKVDEFQKDAHLASDKNALARNSETNPELDLGDAFAKGDYEFRELPTNQSPPGEEGMQSDVNEKKDNESSQYYRTNSSEKFKREYLTNKKRTTNPGAKNELPKILYDNQESRAPDMGGLSFNTYDWEFAPYMLLLKKKVEGNIYPPPAFTRLAIIGGETLLKFKIFPNGEMKDLRVMNYNGHETLMQTSVRAIEISVPFAPLPLDFPEAFLEVTAKFNYLIRKRY